MIKVGDVFWYNFVSPIEWRVTRFVELTKVEIVKEWWDKVTYTPPAKQVYTAKRISKPMYIGSNQKVRKGEKLIIDDIADLADNLESAKHRIMNQIFTRLA